MLLDQEWHSENLCVCTESLSHVWHFATPWTVAARLLRLRGFSKQEYWSGLPCPPPRDLPNSGVEPRPPALQADSFLSEPPGKTLRTSASSFFVFCLLPVPIGPHAFSASSSCAQSSLCLRYFSFWLFLFIFQTACSKSFPQKTP